MEAVSFLPVSPCTGERLSEIKFTDLHLRVGRGRQSKKDVTILHGISGTFRAGQLTAVMGPSGAGKSTLLNVLAGLKVSGVEGQVYVNRQVRDKKAFRKMASYITQDDQLLPQLTVHEYLMIAARLKLNADVSHAEKSSTVSDVLDQLGLSHCRDTRVSNLSGGERKRVCIALELVDNPQILFLDEPTSGLDSFSSLHCVKLLKNISRQGRIVVATVHQPSSRLLELFDRLYVVSTGKCIYQGRVANLVPFLRDLNLHCPSYHNPGDFIIDVASGEYGNVVEDLVKKIANGGLEYTSESENTHPKEPVGPQESANDTGLLEKDLNSRAVDDYPISFLSQFMVLLRRAFILIWRDKFLTLVRFASHVIVGLVIGLLYWRIGNDGSKVYSNAGLLFVNQLFLIFTAVMTTVLTFPIEREVLVREHMNHWYSLKAYYLAKTTADIPFQIIFPALYIAIVYFMTDQPCELNRFLMQLTVSVLLSLVEQGLGIIIGVAASIQMAAFLAPVVNIPFLLFSGFFITLKTIPGYIQWVSYLSFVRYSFEGVVLSTYGYDRQMLDCHEAYCHFKSPLKFLEQLEMQNGVFFVDCLCLLTFFLIVRLAGYYLLKAKLRLDR